MADEPTQSKLILLVDDELPFRQIYKDAVRTLPDVEVIEAEDGEEAMAAVKKHKPDLILLDLIMPKINGFSVLTQIKNDPQYKDIPIIVYSVLGGEADIEKAMKLGANDFTIKGLTPASEVVAKVKRLLE